MIAMSPREVAEMVGGALVGTEARDEAPITSVITDSRQAGPGALFVAIAGEHTDGHDHAADAVAAGASLILADRELRGHDGAALPCVVVTDTTRALGDLAREVLAQLRSQGRPRVLAMTGSVGKTTTKDLLAQVFAPDGPTVAPVRSFNNEVGLPMTVLRCDEDTQTLVLEMGADAPGNIDYLTSIAPLDVACVLVVGRAHLGGMGGIEGVAAEKRTILDGLVPGGIAVLNADDPLVAAMGEGRNDVVTFGRSAQADVRAENVTAPGARVRFDLVSGETSAPVALQLVGEHHLTNALAAAAMAIAAGIPTETVAERLTTATAQSPHRMAVSELPDGVTLIDDSYNANPDSMRAALRALAAIGRGRRTVAVLGEMLELGEGALAEHDAIGRLAVRLDVSHLLVVGSGARAMYTGALLEGSFGNEAEFVADVDGALAWWRENRRRDDVLLVKSSMGAGLSRFADSLAEEARGSGPGGSAASGERAEVST